MSNETTDPVFQLVKSLTKTEKRHFRLFAKRQGSTEGLKFLQLFDAMDGQALYEEEKVLENAPAVKKTQLPNMKANLYRQLLSSLRLYHASQNTDIQLHEQMDYARVLYNKGFYQQSLKMLEKVKVSAQQAEMPHIALMAIDFEKLIESQYITRSLEGRAESLSAEAIDTAQHVSQIHALSNAALRLYGLYIRMGHSRNVEDYNHTTDFFKANMPEVDLTRAGFYEKLYYYQAHVWYHYINQNFKSCYRYAQKWVDLFELYPEMKYKQDTLYIKGLHNLLLSLYNMLYYSRFVEVLKKLEDFSADPDRRPTPNSEVLLFLFIYTNKINSFFLKGEFTEGLQIIPELLENLNRYRSHLDPHRMLTFYYKIASLYFGSGDNYKAIEYLNKIIQYKDTSLREDLQCFARILNLIAHYEAGEDEGLEYQIRSVYRFLGKMNDQQEMQVEIFRFLRNLGDVSPNELKEAFINLKEKLLLISADPYEKRPFLYLDIISWLESKIENVPVQDIVKRKYRHLK
ncbi:hypothetical protein MKJ04_05095 [Pontibacter sp. E15-1]|uniref:hypothetical protein n=1 Tax=Pontibacter sp. E15-1 TaxID=2919918 RepID=UPI001F501818|nr:hypothetical protein [Pontibacter sp. E15-1]MCJ8164209.1 hypothetical protein [Pontibacter sp. E15-1]